MQLFLTIFQIIVSILLVGAILLQQRGTGLSAAFGGEGNVYRTKRGLEKLIFVVTIILAFLFFGAALANIVFGV
jgi:preprotein translocase subunit SecG